MLDPRHLTLRDAQSLSHGDPGERAALAQGGERISIGSAAGGGVPTAKWGNRLDPRPMNLSAWDLSRSAIFDRIEGLFDLECTQKCLGYRSPRDCEATLVA